MSASGPISRANSSPGTVRSASRSTITMPRTIAGSSTGDLNVSVNCLDVHLAARGHKTAIVFEGEQGDVRRLSYRELHAEVCRFANALRAQRRAQGRPRRHLHADDARGRDRDAGLRAHRRDPLGGVRRLFRAVAQGSHRGCARAAPGHRRRRAPRRPRRRAQSRRGQGAGRRLRDDREGHRAQAHGHRGDHAARARRLVERVRRRPGSDVRARVGRTPSIRCSFSTPPARPASPRASSTRAPATCSARR